ncbi:hypothetical protein RJ639_013647 [Escallonia herrerae]|uniref:RanBP2-type domain-containing protein n=1 Tax=Escallonia herrerae TaxID=1293975 RepID=A0AA88VH19_9ASTE|nr:hypothetical protein RJ639_013647 [Escallonia herrerae]
MRGGRGRVSRGMLPLLAVHVANEYRRLDWKPPVTAGLLAANALIYLRPGFLHPILPTIDQVWFNPHLILKYWDFKRYFLSAFYHTGEPHLFYNMISLLWKGIQLETSLGSVKFASMIAALVGMSQGITLLLAKSLLLFGYERAYYHEYAVGFSGVLFAMKVVLNSLSLNDTHVLGMRVPAHYAAWVELILVQVMVPGVSFLGHLGGVLAGLLYIHFKGSYSGLGPLATLSRGISSVVCWPLRYARYLFRSQQRGNYGGGRVGVHDENTSGVWRCRACTFDNSGLINLCEICGTSLGDDGLSTLGLSGHDLSLEELRRRRVERFGR